jgi:hypothetical protein
MLKSTLSILRNSLRNCEQPLRTRLRTFRETNFKIARRCAQFLKIVLHTSGRSLQKAFAKANAALTHSMIFFALTLLNFFFAYHSFVKRFSLLSIVVIAVVMLFPTSLHLSARRYDHHGRPITAIFFHLLSVTAASLAMLVLTLSAPLTLLLSPDAFADAVKNVNTAPPVLMYLVTKTYSLFDILTFLGTLGTLTLIWAGTVIADESHHISNLRTATEDLQKKYELLLKTIDYLTLADPTNSSSLAFAFEYRSLCQVMEIALDRTTLGTRYVDEVNQMDRALAIDDLILGKPASFDGEARRQLVDRVRSNLTRTVTAAIRELTARPTG